MKVKHLIELLDTCNPDAEVLACDADTKSMMLVTGITITEEQVEIQTDDPL